MVDSKTSTGHAPFDPESANSTASARAEYLASFMADGVEFDRTLGTTDEPWSMTTRAAELLAPFRSAKIGDPSLAFAALEFVGMADQVNSADPRQMTLPTFDERDEIPTENALTAPYLPFMHLAVRDSGVVAEPTAPEAIASSEAVARVLERWRKSSRKNEAVSLALAVEALKTLADAHHIADVWGESARWELPYAGEDPFLGMLDVVTSPRQVGEADLREVMDMACAGAADRIIGAADRIDSDYQALMFAGKGRRDTPDDSIPDLVEALGTALTTGDKYEALRSLFGTDLAGIARAVIFQGRNRGMALAKVQPFKPKGRYFVGGPSPESVADMLITAATERVPVETHEWESTVRVGKGRNAKVEKRSNYVRIITPPDFGDAMRELGRVRSADVLAVAGAYQYVWSCDYESSGGSRLVPVPLNQIVSAMMASDNPSKSGNGKSPKRPTNQRKMRRYVRGLIDALRSVQVEWRVWDTEVEAYQEIYTKLIDIVGFGVYKDENGSLVPDTWLSPRDPIALFTNRALSKARILPLPGTEPFDLDDCALYNLLSLRLEKLDWMIADDKGTPGPVKSVVVTRDELINCGRVPALEGSNRKRNPQGGAVELTRNTVRSRQYRELQKITERLPKVSEALLAAREKQGRPKVSITPEYVKPGNASVKVLSQVVLSGRAAKRKRR